MTTTYATSVSPHPWGESRQWMAWAELWVADDMVASSANGDFTLVGGRVTEDITRSICRDVDLTIALPLSPRYSSIAVYTVTSGTSPFEIGLSEVGGTDVLGGGSDTSVQSEPELAPTQRHPLVPTEIGDLLDPNGPAALHVYAGWAGEEVKLGVFDLSSTPVSTGAGGAELTVSGQSYERRIERAGFWQIESATADENLITVVTRLVTTAVPAAVVLPVANVQTVAAVTWKPGDNRMGAVTKLLEAGGLLAYFDRANVFRIEYAPGLDDLTGGTVNWEWEVVDGHNGVVANLHSAHHTFSDEDSYNGVVIEASSHDTAAQTPIIAVQWNTNPRSPLFFDPTNPTISLSGPRPKYISTDLVRTDQEAKAMALTELAKLLMLADQVDCEAPANANVQMNQYVRFASDALGVDGIYRIARVVHDLAGGPMQLTLQRFTAV